MRAVSRQGPLHVFDCFDGTLLRYFRNATSITAEDPLPPAHSIVEIIEDIWANKDRDYNVGCLVKRLQRFDKAMSGEAREMFAAFVPEGDLARFARGLPQALRAKFTETMGLLRDKDFQDLLVNYPRPARTFVRAIEAQDNVTSSVVFRDVAGNEYKPDDYLAAFAKFLRDNEDHIEAVRILLDRPTNWSPQALTELREKLARSRFRFTPDNLQKAHEVRYGKALVDITTSSRSPICCSSRWPTSAASPSPRWARRPSARSSTLDGRTSAPSHGSRLSASTV